MYFFDLLNIGLPLEKIVRTPMLSYLILGQNKMISIKC